MSGGGSKTTTTQEMPAWAQEQSQKNLARATTIADKPYEAYSGQRVAAASPLTVQAQQLAAGPVDLNPYTEQVIDRSVARLGDARDEALRTVTGNAAASGAWGGSAEALARAKVGDDYMQRAGDLAASLYGQGYNTAFDQQMQRSAMLSGLGAEDRSINQQMLDTQYADWLEKRDWDARGLNILNSTLSGIPIPGTQTTKTSGGSQLLGTGMQTAATIASALIMCFGPDTPVELADGTIRRIADIRIGDETRGGRVYAVLSGDGSREPWFDYAGVAVTGSHPVHEGGRWMRVRDSAGAVPIAPLPVLHSISTTGHEVWAHGVRFADHDEVDRSGPAYRDLFAATLRQMNGEG